MRTDSEARKELDDVQPHSLHLGEEPGRTRGLSSSFASTIAIGGRGQGADQYSYGTIMYPTFFTLSMADHVILDPSQGVNAIGKRGSIELG